MKGKEKGDLHDSLGKFSYNKPKQLLWIERVNWIEQKHVIYTKRFWADSSKLRF